MMANYTRQRECRSWLLVSWVASLMRQLSVRVSVSTKGVNHKQNLSVSHHAQLLLCMQCIARLFTPRAVLQHMILSFVQLVLIQQLPRTCYLRCVCSV